MKTNLLCICLVACLIILVRQDIFSQPSFTFFGNNRSDAGLSYNFFVGEDADAFGTTINGFGSGFLLDMFTGRYSIDFLTFGTKNINLSLGVGLALSKYRFSENLLVQKENDMVIYTIDTDPAHDYGSGFFSYGKSKLIYGSVYLPANLNISIKELYFSAGVLVDQYLSGKFKRKFLEDGNKQIVVERNDNFNDYFLNKSKYGVNALIMHKKSGFGIGFTYMLTPFFDEDHGPSINEARVSLTYKFKKVSKKKKAENDSEEVDL